LTYTVGASSARPVVDVSAHVLGNAHGPVTLTKTLRSVELDREVERFPLWNRLLAFNREVSCRLEYPSSSAFELGRIQHHGRVELLEV
jgi:hypothetical protein